MFWEKEYKYSIIDSEISLTDLETYLKENSISLSLNTNTNKWAAFASWYGHEHGFNSFKCASFSNMLASYMTGMPCSAGTEAYYDEERIDTCIFNQYNKIQKEDSSEESKVKALFIFIYYLYSDEGFEDDYELKNDIIHVRLGLSDSLKLETFPGKNDSEKIRYAIRKV